VIAILGSQHCHWEGKANSLDICRGQSDHFCDKNQRVSHDLFSGNLPIAPGFGVCQKESQYDIVASIYSDYWRLNVITHPHYNPERECFAVLL
jgi:hypothetical protein